jgi:hypothetical protein
MKKIILISVYLSISFLSFSQDIITKKNGEEIKAKVTEITGTEVKYKKFEYQTGPIYTVSKSEIFMVKYENGSKDILNEVTASPTVNTNTSDANNVEMEEKGRQDAIMFYKGKNSGAGGTAATVILTSPILGLIPAIACSSSEPSDENLRYKNSQLMKNADYNRAYTEQAHKIKKKKIWTAFGIGSVIWLALIIITLGSGG